MSTVALSMSILQLQLRTKVSFDRLRKLQGISRAEICKLKVFQ